MRTEQLVPCHVCEGLGQYPVVCVSPASEFPRRYLPRDDARACTRCRGTGEILAIVSDEPEKKDEYWEFREEAMNRAEFERDVSMDR